MQRKDMIGFRIGSDAHGIDGKLSNKRRVLYVLAVSTEDRFEYERNASSEQGKKKKKGRADSICAHIGMG